MKGIKKVKQPFNVNLKVADDLPWKIFGSLCRDLGINGGNAKPFMGAIRNRDVKLLLSLLADVSPRRMIDKIGRPAKSDAFDFYRFYQLGAYLKKFPFKGENTRSPAFEKFHELEEHCRLFNTENYKALVGLDEKHPEYYGILDEIRQDIEKLIGRLPPIESIIGHAKHGPGVSLGDQYDEGKVTSFYKWSELPYTVTPGTLELARYAISSDPRWIGALDDWFRRLTDVPIGSPIDMDLFWSRVFDVVDGNRVTTVPKTAEIDRTIAIEPMLNVYLQLGVDHVFKSALRRDWGYDLTSQEANQDLAYEASVTDEMVTLDLKGASETVAMMLCYLLLPPAWMDLLVDLRSPQGVILSQEGEIISTIHYEKISSMGNGFTFALESLIFGALVRCAIRRTKSARKSAVFGDDLIVPTTAYPFLKSLLNLCGFMLNEDKTFVDGPFRESCGKDFFLGYDVRPVFLKRQLKSVQDLLYAHNSLWLLQERLFWAWSVDLSKTLALIRRALPTQVGQVIYGPPGESLDTHLFTKRKLLTTPEGDRFFWQLIAKPKTFRCRGKDFYFRKLMVSLKAKPDQLREVVKGVFIPVNQRQKWDKSQRLDTGNAFEITRRDAVEYYCVQNMQVKTCMSSKYRSLLVRPADKPIRP